MNNSLAQQILQGCFFMLSFFCIFTADYHISLRNNTVKKKKKNFNNLNTLTDMFMCVFSDHVTLQTPEHKRH